MIVAHGHALHLEAFVALGENQVVIAEDALDALGRVIATWRFDGKLFAVDPQGRPVRLGQPFRRTSQNFDLACGPVVADRFVELFGIAEFAIGLGVGLTGR